MSRSRTVLTVGTDLSSGLAARPDPMLSGIKHGFLPGNSS